MQLTYRNTKEALQFQLIFLKQDVEHSLYLLGDGGNSPIGSETNSFKDIKKRVTKPDSKIAPYRFQETILSSRIPKKITKESLAKLNETTNNITKV